MPTVTPTKSPGPKGRNSRSKRVRINVEANVASQDPPSPPSNAPHSDQRQARPDTPLGVAVKHLETSLASLDDHVRSFVQDFALATLKKYSTFFYKKKNLEQMKNTENYVPKKSKFKHPLIVMEEVKKSKEFTALDEELSAFLEETHIKLGKFVLRSSEMNLRAHQERYIVSFIRLLVKAGRLHIGEYDAKNYDE